MSALQTAAARNAASSRAAEKRAKVRQFRLKTAARVREHMRQLKQQRESRNPKAVRTTTTTPVQRRRGAKAPAVSSTSPPRIQRQETRPPTGEALVLLEANAERLNDVFRRCCTRIEASKNGTKRGHENPRSSTKRPTTADAPETADEVITVLVCGQPGVGKSSVAMGLAGSLRTAGVGTTLFSQASFREGGPIDDNAPEHFGPGATLKLEEPHAVDFPQLQEAVAHRAWAASFAAASR